jgi:hypothetical protein
VNQLNLTFRRASSDDLDFVAYCNYTASSPSPDFCYWDSLIEGFGIETMAFIRQAISLDVLAWCRISDFIIAENKGISVAGASGFIMSQDDYRPLDFKNIGKLYNLLEWSGEQMREEEKALRELEKAKQDAEREERRYQEALEKARRDVESATGKAQEKLFSQIEELQKRLAEAEANKKRAISQAQLTKSGQVSKGLPVWKPPSIWRSCKKLADRRKNK